MPAPIVPRPTTPTLRICSDITKVRDQSLRFDHDRAQPLVAAGLVLLAGLPVDCRAGRNRHARAVGPARPASADDDEELVDGRRMPTQDAPGAEPDADD